MAKEYIQIFDNVDFVDLPAPNDERFGQSFFREVNELQVGSANNEYNPKIMRCDSSGMWLGQKSFVKIPYEPTSTKRIKYQVDMLGNITATSFKTSENGKRVRIIDNRVEIYDVNGKLRITLDDFALNFLNPNGVSVGSIIGWDTPDRMQISSAVNIFLRSGDTLFFDSVSDMSMRVNGNIFLLLSSLLDTIYCNRPLTLFTLSADPASAIDGAMFYASPTHPTAPNEFRVFKNGSWRNIITT
jgi:hypothetical protein